MEIAIFELISLPPSSQIPPKYGAGGTQWEKRRSRTVAMRARDRVVEPLFPIWAGELANYISVDWDCL